MKKVVALVPDHTVVIEQARLGLVAQAMGRMTAMKMAAASAELDYLNVSGPIITALQRGAVVEPGRYTAALKKESRRVVKWKREFAVKLGKDEVARVVSATEPTVTFKLVLYVPTRARKRRETVVSQSA